MSGSWSKSDLFEIARWQRTIMWIILLVLAISVSFVLVPPALHPVVLAGAVVVGISQLFFIFKLAVAVRSTVPWLYCLVAIIPFPLVSLLTLLFLNQSATKILNEHSIKVGLMGADMGQFAKKKAMVDDE